LNELFGFDGDDIHDNNWQELNEKVVATCTEKGASQWLCEVAQNLNTGAMVQMTHLPYQLEYWPSLDAVRRARENRLVRPNLVLEPFFFSGFEPDRSRARQRTMELMNFFPADYDQHVHWMRAAMELHKKEGGAAVKLLCAYRI